jgi:hypothetical protein
LIVKIVAGDALPVKHGAFARRAGIVLGDRRRRTRTHSDRLVGKLQGLEGGIEKVAAIKKRAARMRDLHAAQCVGEIVVGKISGEDRLVSSRASEEEVVLTAAGQDVVPDAPEQFVVAGGTYQGVVTALTIELVVLLSPVDLVVAWLRLDRVVSAAPLDVVRALVPLRKSF